MNEQIRILLQIMYLVGELASAAEYKDWDFEVSRAEIEELKRLIAKLEEKTL